MTLKLVFSASKTVKNNKMNVTLTSLEALILKATHDSEDHPEEAAVIAFCAIMRDSTDGYQLGAQALAARIHSASPEAAILALEMVNVCLRQDVKFQAEIGKFRFLNELIKLVSPRYLGHKTPREVQKQVLQYLYDWSYEYSKERKIKIAYDMLKCQGVVKEKPRQIPSSVTYGPRESSLVIDDAKSKLLQRLLQSKKPDDLDYANRMIKSLVREEERRSEANCRRSQEVNAAYHCVGLLSDMLQHSETANDEELELIHELHLNCRRQNTVMQELIAKERDPTKLGDFIHVSGLLSNVDFEYETFRKRRVAKVDSEKAEMSNGDDKLLDFNGPPKGSANGASTSSTLAELGDIFSTTTENAPAAEVLKPVSLLANDNEVKTGEASGKTEGWNELETLGQQLMKLALPDHAKRADGFTSTKPAKKIPMNAIERPSLSLNISPVAGPSNGQSDFNFLIDKEAAILADPLKNLKEEINDDSCLETIHLSIESVQPSTLPPSSLFEEDQVSAVLHFAKDKPLHDVYVIILIVTNKSAVAIEDYEFNGAVSKDSGIRILPASSRTLAACTVFTPPSALTQLLLIRTRTPVTLTYMLTYTRLGQTVTHAGEIVLPLELL